MSLTIGICVGDVTGIGPEVTLKALSLEAATDETRFLLIGDSTIVHQMNTALKLNLPIQDSSTGGSSGRIVVTNPLNHSLPANLKPGAAPAANAAVAWLREAGERCLRRDLDAMVTAPVNKEAIIRAGHKFIGQTEFLADMADSSRTVMMLLGHDERGRWLRVALATVHLALRDVPVKLTQQKILLAIERAAGACLDLGLPRARIAVCGLNPHCGEGGEFGDEEPRVIAPAIAAAKKNGIDIVGPLSGDTVFHQALTGEFDAVVAMFHDQGLAPLKTVAFDTGVNWTLGLPFIRTSPDHGTACNIAGKGIADPSSMISAIRLAKKLAAAKKRGA